MISAVVFDMDGTLINSREKLLEVGAEHIVDSLAEFESYLASLDVAKERV